MADRYFVQNPVTTDRVVLTGPEAHHLSHVMRAKPGDRVTVFDGGGAEFAAEVRQVGRAEVELAILARQRGQPRAADRIHAGGSPSQGGPSEVARREMHRTGGDQNHSSETSPIGCRAFPPNDEPACPMGSRSLETVRTQPVARHCGPVRLVRVGGRLRRRAAASDCASPVAEIAEANCWSAACPDGSLRPSGPEGGFTDDEVAAGHRRRMRARSTWAPERYGSRRPRSSWRASSP